MHTCVLRSFGWGGLGEARLAFCNSVLPRNHTQIGTAMKQLMAMYSHFRMHDKAMRLGLQRLAFCKSFPPENHVQIGSVMEQLTSTYTLLKMYNKGKWMGEGEECLAFYKRFLPYARVCVCE